jgi:hypothetical protein
MLSVDNVPKVWPVVGPLLEKTIMDQGYRYWTTTEIHERLLHGQMQLWGAFEGETCLFVVTEVVSGPAGPEVQVVIGGGHLDEDKAILRHIALIEQWARSIGALSVVVWGRLGWKKALAQQGYTFETALFRRPLIERMM